MKLSQIKGERAYDILTEIVDPISNIMFDEDARKALSDMGEQKQAKDIFKILPKIMKSHKSDLIKVLSILDGVTVAQYKENLTLAKITSDFWDLLNDEESQKLFTSAELEGENK